MIATMMDTTTMSGKDVRMASRGGEFAHSPLPVLRLTSSKPTSPSCRKTSHSSSWFSASATRNPAQLSKSLKQARPKPSCQPPVPTFEAMSRNTAFIDHGELVGEPNDIADHWRGDLVTFLLGCSFTFEHALIRNGVHLPYYGTDKNVAMYKTNMMTAPAGPFGGPMVVTHRWVPREKVVRAVQATSRFPAVHGAPVHIGDPAEIGIGDLSKPDFGDAWDPQSDDDVSMFWACGVTPQAVAMASKPELMITHSPGYMFVTDMHDEDLAVM